MALPYTITKAEFDKLGAEVQALYKKVGDDYKVDLTGAPDAAEALKARDNERAKAEAAKKERDELKTKMDTIEAEKEKIRQEALLKSGDTEALQKSYEEKLTALEAAKTEEAAKLQQSIEKLVVTSKAKALAAKISTVPDLIEPIILKRLGVENGTEGPFARVLDTNGQPSAATIDDLEKELVGNTAYAGIMIGSKAKGGGAPGASTIPTNTKLADMSESERVALAKSDPEGFKTLTQPTN